MTVLRWPPFYWTWTMISTISCSDMKGWSNMKSDMNAHYALLSQVWDEHSKRVLFNFFHDFFLGPSMFFDFFLMVLQLFTTFVNFCHLFSNVLNFPDLRRTGEGFPSAVEQRGGRRKQCCPQMMLCSSCLQVIFYHFIRHIHLDSWKG